MKNNEVIPTNISPASIPINNQSKKITTFQSAQIGFFSGATTSLINHPFQVLRARFQNSLAIKAANPTQVPPPIFPSDPRILLKGFSATLLSMCCLTVTQSIAKQVLTNGKSDNAYAELCAPILGGFASALLTTPLEGAIIRQNKTVTENKHTTKTGVFKNSKYFLKQYGLHRLYIGGFFIGTRTAIVGSGFSLAAPYFAKILKNTGVSPTQSMLISGVFVGTLFALISQPPETLRIEQQFSADEKTPLSIRQAFHQLTAKNGWRGLFKGGAYRIPRTAPGIFINAAVSQYLENYFTKANQQKDDPTENGKRSFKI